MPARAVGVLVVSLLCVACSAIATYRTPARSDRATTLVSPPTRQASGSTVPGVTTQASGVSSLPPPSTFPAGRVYSVSQAISARDEGTLGSQTFILAGYWSEIPLALSCPAPMGEPNKLQLWCSAGFGITERFEMAWTVTSNGVETISGPTSGAMLQPFGTDELRRQLSPTIPIGPIPLVVAGHFDDPDAANCEADVRDVCRDRFVMESIVSYDPESAPTLPPSPSPTPFPSPAPSGLFDASACAGEVPYSFVGWTTADELDIPINFEGHAWAAVTRDVVSLGEWGTDPNLSGQHFSLPMGRRVCLSFDIGGGGGVLYSVVNGTEYRLWDDGRRTRSDEMGPGSGDLSLPIAGAPPPLPEATSVSMSGPNLADLTATIRDWSGELLSARPATAEELALPGSETRSGSNSAALVLPNDPHSVLIVMAECGSDRRAALTITADREVVLLLAADRNDCGNPGARRGAVLTFTSDVPSGVTAITGL
jgi:hypothetical protein